MISVIIPLYNKEPYILKTLESVMNQSFRDFELIIVNDGSTDKSSEKVEKYRQSLKHEISLINQKNQGVSQARNRGVKAAKYDYIAFLDADDWWDSSFLEEMYRLIRDFPNAGIYGSQYYWIKNGVKKSSQNHLPDNYRGYINYIETYLHSWWMPLTSISVVLPKSVFETYQGFNPKLKLGEDFALWIQIVRNYKTAYINKPLAYYFQDIPSKQRALGLNKIHNPDSHYLFNLSSLDEEAVNDPQIKKLIDGLKVRALIHYHLKGRYKFEVQNLLQTINWENQSAYYRRVYFYPKLIVSLFFALKILLAGIKAKIRLRFA